MKRREKWFWIFVGVALLIGFLALIPFNGEICEKPDNSGHKECASHNFPVYLAFKIQIFLDALGVALTALATIAIAAFTLTLKRATDRLWDAGERQLKLASDTAAAQSSDMQASIKAATDAARAAIVSNQIAITNAERQLRAYVTVQQVGMVTHRLPDRMGAHGVVSGSIHAYELSFILKNGGQTPATGVVTNISLNKFPTGIPDNFDFPDSDAFGHGLIGPQIEWRTPSKSVPSGEMEAIGLDQPKWYLWGWVEYNDIFFGTLRHRTEFCFEIERRRLPATNEFWIGFMPHSRFNAAEEDCLRPIDPTAQKDDGRHRPVP
jgi:hypothetical protein